MKCLYEIKEISWNKSIGNKAKWLKKLNKSKFLVPVTYVIPANIQYEYRRNSDRVEECLIIELEGKLDPDKKYAVRSSGEFEDSKEYSFGGQLLTVLDVSGTKQILSSIKRVWESASLIKTSAYAGKAGRVYQSDSLSGVIIQEMVNPDWSGVAFSVNPVTGLNETIIEGIKGRGDALVQAGETPGRWVFKNNEFATGDLDFTPGSETLTEVNRLISKIKQEFRIDVDIEWVLSEEGDIYLLQCRPVTSIDFPTIYSNHISKGFLPGMIKPLVWSVNIPLVNSAWLKLLENLLGSLSIKPEELSKSFYFRAYFNMGTMGKVFNLMGFHKDSLERLLGIKQGEGSRPFRPGIKTIRYLPGMMTFLLSNLTLGKKFKRRYAEIRKDTDRLKGLINKEFSIEKYLQLYNEIYALAEKAAYYNIIMPLSMLIFNRLLNRSLVKSGVAFEELNFAQDFPQLKAFDPQFSIDEAANFWINLSDEEKETAKSLESLNKSHTDDKLSRFSRSLKTLYENFGRLSESGNDFSYSTWAEDHEFLIEIIRRKAKSLETRKNDGSGKITISKKSWKYRKAGEFLVYKEMISSEYTRCYGLFRDLFLNTGEYLTDRGIISKPKDVFYLDLKEHDRLITESSKNDGNSVKEKIDIIKEEMRDVKDIALPSIIYGDEVPPLPRPDEKVFTGVPASPGIFKGKIVVVKGYEDFKKPVEGAILVIPFSDVGWTPIMVNAGAIISESGGVLSHASILARELSIPAIVSVEHACSIQDGTEVTVDANSGKLILEKNG